MSFIAGIVLGLVSGFTAAKIVNKSGEGWFADLVLGVVGTVVGGWLFGLFGVERRYRVLQSSRSSDREWFLSCLDTMLSSEVLEAT